MSSTAEHITTTTQLGSLKLHAAAQTDVGRRRSENQDSYGFLHTACSSLYVVADGMGGARGGGTASAMAVNLIMDRAIDGEGQISYSSLRDAIDLSNRVIFSRSQKDPQLTGMGTTVVALGFSEEQVVVAHVGDSRIYLFRDGAIRQLTRDHTLVQELVDSGAILQKDAASHPIAHMLTRSLGPTASIGVEIQSLPEPVRPGDKFLLCSDGLYNHVESEELLRVLASKPAEAAAEELRQMALDDGGSDNLTIQIIEVHGAGDSSEPVARPDGSYVERFVATEIKIQTIDGLSLNEFAENVLAETTQAKKPDSQRPSVSERPAELDLKNPAVQADLLPPPSSAEKAPEVPKEDFAAESFTADDAPHSALGGMFDEAPRELDLFNSNAALGKPDPHEHKADPKQFGFILGFTVLISVAAYWMFLRVGSLPQGPSASTTNPAQMESAPKDPLIRDLETFEPKEPEIKPLPETTPVVIIEGLDVSQPETVTPVIITPESSPLPPATPESLVSPPLEAVVEAVNNITITPLSTPAVSEAAESSLAPAADDRTLSEKKFADVIAAVSDVRVQPVPRLSLGGTSERINKPTEPIVWENEEKRLAIITNATPVLAKPEETSPPPKLRTTAETQVLADQKAQLRDRISDIDAKLEFLVIDETDRARNKQTRVEMELARLNEVITALQKDLGDSLTVADAWDKLQKKSAQLEPLRLAEELSQLSPEIKEKRSAYSNVSEAYLSTVEKWETDQKDTDLAAKMAALGRDMRTKRLDLESTVNEAMTRGAQAATAKVQRLRSALTNLMRTRDQSNRQVGVLKAFSPTTLQRRQELQKSFLEERKGLIEKLKKLQASLPDEEEQEFRSANAELFYSGA